MGDLVVHGSNETDCGHFPGFMMHVSSDDHHVFGEIIRFRGMPDRESNFHVHLEDDTRHGGETFLQGIGQHTLGRDSEGIQAELKLKVLLF